MEAQKYSPRFAVWRLLQRTMSIENEPTTISLNEFNLNYLSKNACFIIHNSRPYFGIILAKQAYLPTSMGISSTLRPKICRMIVLLAMQIFYGYQYTRVFILALIYGGYVSVTAGLGDNCDRAEDNCLANAVCNDDGKCECQAGTQKKLIPGEGFQCRQTDKLNLSNLIYDRIVQDFTQ